MPNIDHSNIPAWMDAVPVGDITTGDHPALVLNEMYKNAAGHHARLSAIGTDPAVVRAPLVTNAEQALIDAGGDYNAALALHEFKLPRWIRTGGFDPLDIENEYHDRMRTIRAAFASIMVEIRLIWKFAGLTANRLQDPLPDLGV